MEKKKHIAKWGFGMAPISSTMRERYDKAVQSVFDFILENTTLDSITPEDISELKGMFNRCVREDQWDWFSVHAELGNPSKRDMRAIVNGLKDLRSHALAQDDSSAKETVQQLINRGILNCLSSYQGEYAHSEEENGHGWVYILSTRDSPNILKIGMTTRSVSQRVKEINSATGVLYPLSARAVYRVKNAFAAESEIFQVLAPYRIRYDREFFDIPFNHATRAIREYINKENLAYMMSGEIIWYDAKKQYGFINDGTEEDVFVHQSQIKKEDGLVIRSGSKVEYSLLVRPQGKLAVDVRFIKN